MFTTDAIALTSPSGKISARALKSAQGRIRQELFGAGLGRPQAVQPTTRERDLATAAEYRELANRGMRPRKYRHLAEQLEAKWNSR